MNKFSKGEPINISSGTGATVVTPVKSGRVLSWRQVLAERLDDLCEDRPLPTDINRKSMSWWRTKP